LRTALIAALVASVFAAAPATAARKVHKVSGATVVGSDVEWLDFQGQPRISPDGEWIIWIQDAEVNNALALWAARRSGGVPKRLSGTLAPGGVFKSAQFTPDSKRILYVSEQEGPLQFDLYSVPLLGTAADGVKINPPLVGSHAVNSATITADGSRVVFTTSTSVAQTYTLYSAPVDGSAPPTPLDGPYSADGATSEFVIAGPRVVFGSRQAPGSPTELWSVPVVGGVAVRLSPTFAGNGEVSRLTLAPGGSRVVFRSEDAPTQPARELWSALVQGSTGSAIRIADIAIPAGDVIGWEFSPNDTRVVFIADRDVDEKRELYSVPVDGSASPVKLNTSLIAAGDVSYYDISLDGTRVAYDADWAVDERREVFSVPIAGPSAGGVRLNRNLVAGETAVLQRAWADLVEYAIADPALTAATEVRGAPLTGPASAGWEILTAATELSGPGVLTPDWTILRGDVLSPGAFELWTRSNDGSGSPNSLFSLLWGSVVLGEQSLVSPNGVEYFFLAAADGDPMHLWATKVDGSQGFPARLSPVPAGGGGVIDAVITLEMSLDGRGVLYEADSDVP
ncbi:MAG: hypothetical protein ABIU84_10530, partial [Thermoanaerobaculia bacterium]